MTIEITTDAPTMIFNAIRAVKQQMQQQPGCGLDQVRIAKVIIAKLRIEFADLDADELENKETITQIRRALGEAEKEITRENNRLAHADPFLKLIKKSRRFAISGEVVKARTVLDEVKERYAKASHIDFTKEVKVKLENEFALAEDFVSYANREHVVNGNDKA